MAQGHLVPPETAPLLNIPQSDSIVKVSIIDSTSWVNIPMDPFLGPHYKGKDRMTGPTYSFFIQHSSGKRILFDLGVRPDWENYSPVLVEKFKKMEWDIGAKKNVASILQEDGINVKSGAIDAVVWSHHHWDHLGDLAGTFPSSTQLIVGPGFKKAHLPGYPQNKNSPLLQQDFEDRDVREVDIASVGTGRKVGRFNAYDYFGDGSFYLLDTPGHAQAHICGLARTTADTFIIMGGDASHHGGEIRPSEYLPLPANLSPSPLPKFNPCPGHLLQEAHYDKSATKPFYNCTESFAYDLEVCNWTIAGLQEFDAAENVFVVLAHDDSLSGVIDVYPKSANDWFEKGVAERAKWMFLKDFEEAVEQAADKKQ
ncbi:hypothetical protein AAFC00_006758 [Neodothiora populina]|uniref:Metallo-beta-lactamase domain-containing protein n=1 Tax=Neodothiora populina TaxID=2781224 RepID=A0ABR3PB80_9PEZI